MKFFHKLCLALLFSLFALTATAQSIDINTATAEELATLDGVGPAKAAAIVEYRTIQGPFTSVDDLLKVKGIGDKTLEKNRSQLSAGTAAEQATPMKPAMQQPVAPSGAPPAAQPTTIAPPKPAN